MKLQSDPLCLPRKEGGETSLHFLGECAATLAIRRDVKDSPIMSSGELRTPLQHSLEVCESLKEIYISSPTVKFGVAH